MGIRPADAPADDTDPLRVLRFYEELSPVLRELITAREVCKPLKAECGSTLAARIAHPAEYERLDAAVAAYGAFRTAMKDLAGRVAGTPVITTSQEA